jgi:hypothetical protein
MFLLLYLKEYQKTLKSLIILYILFNFLWRKEVKLKANNIKIVTIMNEHQSFSQILKYILIDFDFKNLDFTV